MPDEISPDPVPASGDRVGRDLGRFLENGIKSLPHEFGLFGAEDRLLVASKGLAERCESNADRLTGIPFNEILQRMVPKIISVDGIGDTGPKLTSQGILQRQIGRASCRERV
jgi:hypothetical protein